MRRKIAFLILAVSLIPLVGCAKKQQVKEEPVTAATGPSEAAEPAEAGEEVAQGDERDAILALQRVHFELDSATLNEASKQALTEAAAKLKDRPTVDLHVEGHADSQGATEYNLQLGENRATAVRDYLARLGVDAGRLFIISYGEEKPLSSAETSEGHAVNRRVDFRLMKGDVELVLEPSPTVGK